jgi:hypothetical protein
MMSAGFLASLAVLAVGPTQTQAQHLPISGNPAFDKHGPGCICHKRWAVFPRTYSYYYNFPFNQPRHVRVCGPDGKSYWITTVHGLPRDVPYPSY